MEPDRTADFFWKRLSERIAGMMGLHFPPERRPDLCRGLGRVAEELGFADVTACGEWLLSEQPTEVHLRLIASHLTVGETYFFREKKTLEALAGQILPALIEARRNRERQLRIWSAGCCTGEEPYSLAILLSQVIPDLANWRVTILATDINERFLQKASAGIYSEWSFRETPPAFKERYFQQLPDGRYAVLPEIKKRVVFAHLNLAEDVFPSLATNTNAMDIIFCRNVLMYFTPPQMKKVIGNLRRALIDGGWLMVSPTEASQVLFSEFRTGSYPGVTLYQKVEVQDRHAAGWSEPTELVVAPTAPAISWTPPELTAPEPVQTTAALVPRTIAVQLYERGDYADAVETLLASSTPPATAEDYSLLARALANQGQLRDALAWCDRWLAADKLDAAGHYVRAVTLQELGQREEARRSLQRAIYLQPGLVLAHFALGNLARATDQPEEANRHFTNALSLLRGDDAGVVLPESDGLTAGRLAEIVTSLLGLEAIS